MKNKQDINQKLAGWFYWNQLLPLNFKTISLKAAKRKINHPNYLFIYFQKNHSCNDEQNIVTNTKIIPYYEFEMYKLFLNKKQTIIILNKKFEIMQFARQLRFEGFKVILIKC